MSNSILRITIHLPRHWKFGDISTGEEVLHEGWSSYDNLFGVLMITVREFLENVTDFCGKLFYILGELA
jgi:hypothetical protein